MEEKFNISKHSISINERKTINLSGVKKIENFDEEEFLLETNMGFMHIKGNELEIIKLDTNSGNVAIKGILNSLTYLDSNKKKKEDSFISKLFK